MDNTKLWTSYQNRICHCPEIGLWLDISRMNFPDDFSQP